MNECLKEELCFANSLIKIYSEHESLWYHKRYVITELLKNHISIDKKDLLKNEHLFIEDLRTR